MKITIDLDKIKSTVQNAATAAIVGVKTGVDVTKKAYETLSNAPRVTEKAWPEPTVTVDENGKETITGHLG